VTHPDPVNEEDVIGHYATGKKYTKQLKRYTLSQQYGMIPA